MQYVKKMQKNIPGTGGSWLMVKLERTREALIIPM